MRKNLTKVTLIMAMAVLIATVPVMAQAKQHDLSTSQIATTSVQTGTIIAAFGLFDQLFSFFGFDFCPKEEFPCTDDCGGLCDPTDKEIEEMCKGREDYDECVKEIKDFYGQP